MGGNDGIGASMISSTSGIGIIGDGICSSISSVTSGLLFDGGVTNNVESIL
jgi:hypothetical protein